MIFRKITEAYRKSSYRKKVFAGMFISAIIPILICTAGVLITFKMSNEQKLSAGAQEVISRTNEKLNKNCEIIKEATHRISNAPATQRLLEENNESDLIDAYRLLYSSAVDNDRHADYALYDKEGTLKLYAGDSTHIKQDLSVNWGILYELSKEPKSVKTRCGRIYDGSDKTILLRIGQAVVGKDGELSGFVIAQVTESSFKDMLSGISLDGTGAIYLLDKFTETVYASSTPERDELASALNALTADDSDAYVVEKGVSRYYYSENTVNDIRIIYRQYVESYNMMNRGLYYILSIAGIAGLVFSLFISRKLSSRYYRPIRRMSEAMAKVKKGDFTARVKVDSDDELGRLSETFNGMSSKLTENMEELVNREKELSNANIKMMQAQLNPHFIYNTLDTMKWLGKANEIPEVATLSSGLAAILRASISSGQIVTLEKEVELVENYASIQQIRFEDKFIFLTDIPDELKCCEVPKLMLQPIVENSIIHGFEGRDYGQVLVTARRAEEKVIITVQDDGIGVKQEEADKLNNHEQLAKGTNIGFHNVDAIIRLHYGEQFGLFIKRGENGGTEVTYTLPYKPRTE